ncbi:uncharacterized protein LOC107022190 [Solanum pennellii]|uniref:Uncharacterized protein LOC107022190 n=1 Tax=Solanum pennellii TaxID=28526 RepID=A0ABM1GZX2_SOLPN|nr:uncharacterized protein LOC107022190 [Solanum pennellii]
MRLLMEGRTVKRHNFILHDVLGKVDSFIFPILDCEVDFEVPIILARPFLSARRTLLDMEKGQIKFRLNNKEASFNICMSIKLTVSAISYGVESIDAIEKYGSLVAALEQNKCRSKWKILELDMKHCESPPAKPSIEKARKLVLNALPPHLRYVFVCRNHTLLVIIAADLNMAQVEFLVAVLKRFKRVIGWTIADIIGISPGIFSHRIKLMSDQKPSFDPQRSLNPPMQEVAKKEIIKWLDPKSSTLLWIPVIGWRICMDDRKLNLWTEKDHFPIPFMDQMLDILAGKRWYCFLDGYSRYNQIFIASEDQDKTTFTSPYRTCAFKRLSFGSYKALPFERYMKSKFSYMVEDTIEMFTDYFSVVDDSFDWCLSKLAEQWVKVHIGDRDLKSDDSVIDQILNLMF